MVSLRFLVVAGMCFYPQSSQLLTKPSVELKKKKTKKGNKSTKHSPKDCFIHFSSVTG